MNNSIQQGWIKLIKSDSKNKFEMICILNKCFPFQLFLKNHLKWKWRDIRPSMKRALYIHPPHLQFLMARDSNPQPMDYESDALTIRLRLPPQKTEYTEYLRTGS